MMKKRKTIGVIPARLASTRFPGKMLAPLDGKPLVLHAYEKALQAKELDEVIIAVDDERTLTILEKFNARAVMTSIDHQSGTDRVAEAVNGMEADVVVNIQGDEPLMDPNIIDQLVEVFNDRSVHMATAAGTNLSYEEMVNPNIVKVILNENMDAVDFQRSIKNQILGGYYRHIGIYAFRSEFLMKFTSLEQTENELKLKLEQLRALDHNIQIRTVVSNYICHGVDTPEDLEIVSALLLQSGKNTK